jgi:hypothetical protein
MPGNLLCLTNGGGAAGSWLCGVVADHYSLTASLGWAAMALLAVAAAGYAFPIYKSDEFNTDPVGRFDAPELARDLEAKKRTHRDQDGI